MAYVKMGMDEYFLFNTFKHISRLLHSVSLLLGTESNDSLILYFYYDYAVMLR